MVRNDCWNNVKHREMLDYTSSRLWKYINKNSVDATTKDAFLKLTALSQDDLMSLFEIRFLLSDDVMYFINTVMSGIINRLSKESLNKTITIRNKIIGKVDWQKTIITQTLSGNDKTIYVTKTVSNKFDLPENRLMRYIIELIHKLAKKYIVDSVVGRMWYEDITLSDKWTEKVKYIYSKTQTMLKNPIIKQISRISEITEKMIIATRYQRNNHYGDLADLAEMILQAMESPFKYLMNELGDKILEPLNRDDLYEIAVLFKVISVIQEYGWKEEEIGLIGGKKRYVSLFEKEDKSLKVYYQKLPSLLKANSKYSTIMKDYGVSDRARRPDIIIEIEVKGKLEYLIVEVKRSQNLRYLSDGAYKVFGYMKDYETIINDDVSIEGFLVGWRGINTLDYNENTKTNLFIWENIGLGMKQYLDYKLSFLDRKIHEEMFPI